MAFPSQQLLLGQTRRSRGEKQASVSQKRRRRPRALPESDLRVTSVQVPPVPAILQAIFLRYDVRFLSAARCLCSYVCTDTSKIPSDPYMYIHLTSHPSLHLYSMHAHTYPYAHLLPFTYMMYILTETITHILETEREREAA